MNKSGLNVFINKLKQRPALHRLKEMMSPRVKAGLRHSIDRATRPGPIREVVEQTSLTNDLLAMAIYEQAKLSPRMQDQKRLVGKGFKIYSQHDEDGIIEEIFRRIGTTNRYFVEFGVGDGLENCTTYLLLKGWRGLWIEASAAEFARIEDNMRFLIDEKRLSARCAFVDTNNIESHFASAGVPEEFELLSIDIDFNDYWLWQAIKRYRPRVVAIEYNASFGPSVSCTVPYTPNRIWDYTNYFGASLGAIADLGREKGYALVGCNYTGVTAFLVRDDLVGDKFARPFTAANHYEPARYFVRMPNGHPAGFGPVVDTGTGSSTSCEQKRASRADRLDPAPDSDQSRAPRNPVAST